MSGEDKEHTIRFSDAELQDGKLVETNIRNIKQSSIMACRFYIMVAGHYREDGSCKCDDAEERRMMIRAWGYTEKDFKGIPLREEKSRDHIIEDSGLVVREQGAVKFASSLMTKVEALKLRELMGEGTVVGEEELRDAKREVLGEEKSQ
jgi:hypothetical protein